MSLHPILIRLRDSQRKLAAACERLLPERLRRDGNRDFVKRVFPAHLAPQLRLYDVGGGKNPIVNRVTKERLGLTIIGIDPIAEELDAAPAGLYDGKVNAGIESCVGVGDGDLVVLQSVFEHVDDTQQAFKALRGLVRDGGKVLFFVPSRTAAFAWLNRVLPERLKRRLLYGIYPECTKDQGFPARYDQCTPQAMKRLANQNDFEVVEEHYYYRSSYFDFFFPAYLLWRLGLGLRILLSGEKAAETFAFVLVAKSLVPATVRSNCDSALPPAVSRRHADVL